MRANLHYLEMETVGASYEERLFHVVDMRLSQPFHLMTGLKSNYFMKCLVSLADGEVHVCKFSLFHVMTSHYKKCLTFSVISRND